MRLRDLLPPYGPLALALVGLLGCAGDSSSGSPAESIPDTSPTSDAATVPETDVTSSVADAAPDGGLDIYPDVAPLGCQPIPPVVLDTARLTIDPETGALRDALGRDVLLRGINAGGRSKWAPFVPFPIDPDIELPAFRDAARTFFARLPAWGLDTVRLTFSWEALEPTEGNIDARYLDRYVAMVDVCWELGIRVVVDVHQDVYASPFCGDGFPIWTIDDPNPGPPHHDCPDWFTGYLFGDDVRGAFDRFWDEGSGVQGKLRDAWSILAGRLAEHPGVLGFEILNEPGWGHSTDIDVWKKDVLTPFHTKMVAHLRAIAPDVLVLYDAPGVDAVTTLPLRFRPEGDGVMFAPHLYDAGLITGVGFSGLDPFPELAALAKLQSDLKTPSLLGEFGVGAATGEQGAEWLAQTMDAIDAHRVSATLWECSQNEELWNDEDLSVIDVDGNERPILDVYVRPWLRAVAGSAPTFAWDRASSTATVRWTAGDGVTEVVLPKRLFPNGPQELVVEGEGACHTFDPDRGELRVTAPAGVVVDVSLRP